MLEKKYIGKTKEKAFIKIYIKKHGTNVEMGEKALHSHGYIMSCCVWGFFLFLHLTR